MKTELILELITLAVLLLIASYFVFYKSWLTELGKEVAKLSTTEQMTRLTEGVKKEFQEQIEAYKSKLSEELTLKVEPLKSELAKTNITHQIQFSFLHQERAKVTIDLYKKLVELHSAMVDWTAFMHPVHGDAAKEGEERTKRANAALHDFRNFYLLNKLFFTKSISSYIEEVFKEYWDKGWDFGFRQNMLSKGQIRTEYSQEYLQDMSRISEELRTHLPQKIGEIEKKFKELLSIKDE